MYVKQTIKEIYIYFFCWQRYCIQPFAKAATTLYKSSLQLQCRRRHLRFLHPLFHTSDVMLQRCDEVACFAIISAASESSSSPQDVTLRPRRRFATSSSKELQQPPPPAISAVHQDWVQLLGASVPSALSPKRQRRRAASAAAVAAAREGSSMIPYAASH